MLRESFLPLPSSLSGAGAPVVAFVAIASKAPHKQSNRPSFGNYFYGGATSRHLRPGVSAAGYAANSANGDEHDDQNRIGACFGDDCTG
jgi:hypothetical protein